jgi:hypothetical protein
VAYVAAVVACKQGREDGYEDGFDDGYQTGFADGFQAGAAGRQPELRTDTHANCTPPACRRAAVAGAHQEGPGSLSFLGVNPGSNLRVISVLV